MTSLEATVRAGQWERAAVYLVAALLSALEALPSDSLSELLYLLGGEGAAGDGDEV